MLQYHLSFLNVDFLAIWLLWYFANYCLLIHRRWWYIKMVWWCICRRVFYTERQRGGGRVQTRTSQTHQWKAKYLLTSSTQIISKPWFSRLLSTCRYICLWRISLLWPFCAVDVNRFFPPLTLTLSNTKMSVIYGFWEFLIKILILAVDFLVGSFVNKRSNRLPKWTFADLLEIWLSYGTGIKNQHPCWCCRIDVSKIYALLKTRPIVQSRCYYGLLIWANSSLQFCSSALSFMHNSRLTQHRKTLF